MHPTRLQWLRDQEHLLVTSADRQRLINLAVRFTHTAAYKLNAPEQYLCRLFVKGQVTLGQVLAQFL